jgi:hypothetical protein
MGGSAGMMNCITDLGGGKKPGKINWAYSKPAAGIFFSGTYQDRITLRIDYIYGQVKAADSILRAVRSYVHGRYERNLSFKSNINELALSLEIYPALINVKQKVFYPYLVTGIGLFSFEPKTNLNGQWYSLRPLRTEGQGFREYADRKIYKPTQVFFSAGSGLKYEAGSLVCLQLEFNYRFLHTDYLDDVSTAYIDPVYFDTYLTVKQAFIAKQLYKRMLALPADSPFADSQRGNPSENDAYFTFMLRVGILLGQKQR